MVYGDAFLNGGEIIRSDPFSWTVPNYMWGNSYFLYQIIVAFIFNKFGLLFLGISFGLVAAFAVWILSFRNLNFTKIAFITLGSIVASTNVAIRPHTLSFFLFALLLIFLEKELYVKRKHIFLWFLFFALWANIHRAFVAGLLVFGVFLVLQFFHKKKYKKAQKSFINIGCFIASVLGTLVTPFPISLWKTGVFFDVTTIDNLRSIAEWQPLALVSQTSIFLAISGIVFVYILGKKHKQLGPVFAIIAAFLFSLAFVSAAFTFFWAAIFVFIVSRHLDIKIQWHFDFWSRLPIFLSLLAVSLALFSNFITSLLVSYNFEDRLILDGYPVFALEYLNKKGVSANLFNSYEWGGFIDWRYNNFKVFIDGRMAGWRKSDGKSILGDYLKIVKGNCDVANGYEIETVLVRFDSKLSCFDGWEIEYQDEIAKILRRG